MDDTEGMTDYRDKAHIVIALYIKPILLVIGILGNTLSIAVLRRRSFQSSSSVYLLMIAVVSLIYCIFYIPFVVKEYITDGSDTYVWVMVSYQCYIGLFVLDSASYSAFWITAAVAVERCIVVGLPLWSRRLCRRKVAWIICAVLVIIAMLLNIPRCLECFPVELEDYKSPANTTVGMEMRKLKGYNPIIAVFASIILSSILPFVVIVCSNFILLVFIIKKWQTGRNRFTVTLTTHERRSDVNAVQKKALTAMVLSNLGLYIFSQAFATYLHIKVFVKGYEYYLEIMDESIGFYSNTLSFTYFCFSSLIYLIISSLYRQKVKKLLFGVLRRSQESKSTTAHTEIVQSEMDRNELQTQHKSDSDTSEIVTQDQLFTTVI